MLDLCHQFGITKVPRPPLSLQCPQTAFEVSADDDEELVSSVRGEDVTAADGGTSVSPGTEERTQIKRDPSASANNKHQKRQGDTSSKKLDLVRAYYDKCSAEASKMEWKSDYYREHFLGTVPHVLAGLERLNMVINKFKRDARDRYSKAKDDELEEVNEKLNKAKFVLI